jgi:hypothetical protein
LKRQQIVIGPKCLAKKGKTRPGETGFKDCCKGICGTMVIINLIVFILL